MNTKLLSKCMPYANATSIELYGDKLMAAMESFFITGPAREAAFIAQIAHESGSLRYVKELASGEAYEGRLDLGNTEPGDGVRFKGRGLIQLTGRANYALISKGLAYDFITHPEDLEKPGPACYSACWFWHFKGLNRLADIEAFDKITMRINGGLTHQEERVKFWEHCKEVLYKENDSPRNINDPLPS